MSKIIGEISWDNSPRGQADRLRHRCASKAKPSIFRNLSHKRNFNFPLHSLLKHLQPHDNRRQGALQSSHLSAEFVNAMRAAGAARTRSSGLEVHAIKVEELSTQKRRRHVEMYCIDFYQRLD